VGRGLDDAGKRRVEEKIGHEDGSASTGHGQALAKDVLVRKQGATKRPEKGGKTLAGVKRYRNLSLLIEVPFAGLRKNCM